MNRFLHALICITCLLSFNAFAGLNTECLKKENPYNPNEDPGDIELPMPDGLKMVLRAVAVPTMSSYLFDKKIKLGIRNLAENEKEDRSFYESSIDSYLGAAIKYDDLSESWAKKISKDFKDCQFYFIGKYELTNGQWNAVMGGQEKDNCKNVLPKTDISWYDIQVFLQKYNEWLLSNHPDAVPVIEDKPMYLRLPTEAEWEYAARGGDLSPEEDREDFIKLNGKNNVGDYAVFGDNNRKEPARIGSKNPNKIKLYDTSGNVAELIQGGFRYSVTEFNLNSNYRYQRLHGSEGGLIAKGGHYKSSERDVYPGKRIEMNMFDKGDDNKYRAHKSPFLGARLVLSSINIPGKKRTDEIISETKELISKNKEISKAINNKEADKKDSTQNNIKQEKITATANIKDAIVDIDSKGDPFYELQRIYNATSSPVVKANLKKYEGVLEDMAVSLYKERLQNLSGNIRTAIFKVDVINNIMHRFYDINSRYYQLLAAYKKADSKIDEKTNNKFIEIMKDRYDEMDMASRSYKDSLEELSKYPEDIVSKIVQEIKNKYQGQDKYNQRFQRSIQCLVTHLDYTRKQGGKTSGLTNDKIWKDFKFEYEEIYKYLENFEKKR